MKNIKLHWLMITGLLALIAVSCKKDYNPALQLPHQFKPGDINITAGETQAKLTWSPSLFTTGTNVTYTVELAKDSLFQTVDYSAIVDTSTIIITDSILTVGQNYVARVKANALNATAESGWVLSGKFKITGEQILSSVLDAELSDTSVVLRWRTSPGLTKIVITPTAGGTAINVPLTPADVTAEQKLVKGLTQLTAYTAEIYKNNTRKGVIEFTTKEHSIYAVILSPGDDLPTAINNAASGDIIGLQNGTYDLGATTSGFAVDTKNITIASVSNNPSNVTILNCDFVLKGTAPGIKLSGLSLTGPTSGYIVDINASATNIGNITIDNCRISFNQSGFAIVRANRGALTMGTLSITNTVGIGLNLNNNYAIAMMDKIKFDAVVIKNSTFSSFQRTIVSAATALSGWSSTVTIDKCTFNDFGGGGKSAVLDGSTNNIALSITNTIFANTPFNGGTVGNDAVKSGGSSSLQKVFYYNCSNGATTPAPINWPSGAAATTDISAWTAATTDFTLPAGSALRTAGTDNGPVGDPRWAL
jgi:hypothetical protein